MQKISRLAALLLLIVVGSAFSGAQAFLLPAAHTDHPAGCHGHMPAAPTPAPASHQCCVAGHQSAMPSASFSARPPVAQVCGLRESQHVSLSSLPLRNSAPSAISSGSPPGAAPLRI